MKPSICFFLLGLLALNAGAADLGLSQRNDSFKSPKSSWKTDDKVPHLKDGDLVEGENVLLVTHSNSRFDGSQSTKENVNRLIDSFRGKGLPVIYLVDNFEAWNLEMYFPTRAPSYLYLSPGGQFDLRIRAKKITIAGGFFELCASQTVRNSIGSAFNESRDPADPIKIEYADDSIYTLQQVTLAETLKNKSNQEMIQYLLEYYFPRGSLGLLSGAKEGISFEEYTFDILRDGTRIESLGHGKRTVQLNFVERIPGRLQE